MITDSTVSDNSSGQVGGGILNLNGTLTVTGSALLANSSDYDGDALFSNVDSLNASSVTGSCIVGNGVTAVFNSQPAFQNATGNWWGDPSGPSGAGPGIGDSVGVNIDFSGWLAAPPAICAP